MDDIRDQMDVANEISNAISQPVGFGMEFDEDELNEELERLEQEELDSQLLDTKPTPVAKIPTPVHALATPLSGTTCAPVLDLLYACAAS